MSSIDWLKIPPTTDGLKIGLLGGSFNPAHDGHRLISVLALQRLELDYIWWLVTPGNPLKDNQELPPIEARAEFAQKLADHPNIIVTGFEASVKTRYTLDTLRTLTDRLPAVNFVWLMGADNLMGFHEWQGWREIFDLMPIAIVDRPGSSAAARASVAAQALSAFRIKGRDISVLAERKAPAWAFIRGSRSSLSSTAIRAAAKNKSRKN